jgi:hypothetical protein
MLIPDKFYRYYNDAYTPPIDMVILALEENVFKVILVNEEYRVEYYPTGSLQDYDQDILSRDILSGRLKRMEDET